MSDKEITIKRAAEMLGLGISTVRRRAALMGARKVGRDYLLTPAQVEQIKADLQAPGKRGPKVLTMDRIRPKPRGRKRKALKALPMGGEELKGNSATGLAAAFAGRPIAGQDQQKSEA